MSFRTKPVVIEAWPHTGDLSALPQWMADAFLSGSPPYTTDDGAILVHTLEGVMRAEVGDWIIQGVKGELYPCKPDIFALTYEPLRWVLPTDIPEHSFVESREEVGRLVDAAITTFSGVHARVRA